MWKLLGYIAFAVCWSDASMAQNLTPYDPDIVFECFANNQPDTRCEVFCGSELAGPSSGSSKAVYYENVDRAEIFNRGNTGHLDTRSLVFIRWHLPPPNVVANIVGLYIGPPIFCAFNSQRAMGSQPQILNELRMTKFRFN